MLTQSRNRILVVDDSDHNREMYAEYLAFSGFDVSVAVNGESALAEATERPPDLVVLDLTMPRMDGWTLAKALKSDARTRDAVIVVVTGHAFKGAEERARAAGADVFLTKPCLPEDLIAEVRRQLDR